WFIGDTNAALGSGTGLMNFVYGANPWIVYLNNAERMRIDASGNLLVGTTTSYGKISVYQTAASPVVYGIGGGVVGNFVSADVTNAAVWNFGRDNVSTGNFVHSYNGTVLTSITTSGNLLLGTTSAGASATKVIGMANATAPTTSPAGMGQLYVEGGALKFRGSSGTVTTIAPA
ncbi:MAG TPA: hypothetical protein VLA24_16020, partial [Pseudomonadales bacterium]|nr:hypothetical protein [Pseudomonadales bacterium]